MTSTQIAPTQIAPRTQIEPYLPPRVTAPDGAIRFRFVLLEPADERLDRLQSRCPAADPVCDLRDATGTHSVGMGMVVDDSELVAAAWLVGAPAAAGRCAVAVRDDYRHRRLGSSLLDIGIRHAQLLGVACLHAQIPAGDQHSVHLLRARGTVAPVTRQPGRDTLCLRLGDTCGAARESAAAPTRPAATADRKQATVLCLCRAALHPHSPHQHATRVSASTIARGKRQASRAQ